MVMTTLNGLPRECDSFIRGICARRKLTKFNKLWEECVQEEGRIVFGKDKVFEKFKEFKVLVENIYEKKIKTLRLYNGGEFTSNEFKDFSKEVGIKRELTTPYNL